MGGAVRDLWLHLLLGHVLLVSAILLLHFGDEVDRSWVGILSES